MRHTVAPVTEAWAGVPVLPLSEESEVGTLPMRARTCVATAEMKSSFSARFLFWASKSEIVESSVAVYSARVWFSWVWNWVVSLVRQIRPEVAVTHAWGGEYGHGQHKATVHMTAEGVTLAADPNYDGRISIADVMAIVQMVLD